MWHARDETLDRDVALKEVTLPAGIGAAGRSKLADRIKREARLVARLNHPGIVRVYDIVDHRGSPVIVMEFIPGESLGKRIERDGPIPAATAASMAGRLLAALRHAHAAGVVHRDLKPDNILLTENRCVLTDFGIARSLGGAVSTLTAAGTLVGTPAYLAPELLEGQEATAAADLWSLGATLFAAVEGTPPFTGDTIDELFTAVLAAPVPPAPHAGPLTALLKALLVKDPAKRGTVESATALIGTNSPQPPEHGAERAAQASVGTFAAAQPDQGRAGYGAAGNIGPANAGAAYGGAGNAGAAGNVGRGNDGAVANAGPGNAGAAGNVGVGNGGAAGNAGSRGVGGPVGGGMAEPAPAPQPVGHNALLPMAAVAVPALASAKAEAEAGVWLPFAPTNVESAPPLAPTKLEIPVPLNPTKLELPVPAPREAEASPETSAKKAKRAERAEQAQTTPAATATSAAPTAPAAPPIAPSPPAPPKPPRAPRRASVPMRVVLRLLAFYSTRLSLIAAGVLGGLYAFKPFVQLHNASSCQMTYFSVQCASRGAGQSAMIDGWNNTPLCWAPTAVLMALGLAAFAAVLTPPDRGTVLARFAMVLGLVCALDLIGRAAQWSLFLNADQSHWPATPQPGSGCYLGVAAAALAFLSGLAMRATARWGDRMATGRSARTQRSPKPSGIRT